MLKGSVPSAATLIAPVWVALPMTTEPVAALIAERSIASIARPPAPDVPTLIGTAFAGKFEAPSADSPPGARTSVPEVRTLPIEMPSPVL